MKVIHVHSDKKFIWATRKYLNEADDTSLIVLGESELPISLDVSNVYFFKRPTLHLKEIIALCMQADVVFLYALDPVKSKIALSLPKKVKIIWRFFGLELYSQIPDLCISERSLELMESRSKTSLKHRPGMMYANLKSRILGNYKSRDLMPKAIDRVDLFMGLFMEEYQFLKSIWPKLPPFIQIPYERNSSVEFALSKGQKKGTILLGNNRSAYNNHMELLDILKKVPYRHDYDFKLLFNYGQTDHYTEIIKKEAKKIPGLEIIDSFIPRDEFEQLYIQTSAFVLNGYRQMAVGNIILGLRNGVKVYLNTKNIHYDWLVAENFTVFTLEDFEDDLNAGNITLEQEVMERNYQQWDRLAEKYSIDDFHNKLLLLIQE